MKEGKTLQRPWGLLLFAGHAAGWRGKHGRYDMMPLGAPPCSLPQQVPHRGGSTADGTWHSTVLAMPYLQESAPDPD